jgi:hypothetical protein
MQQGYMSQSGMVSIFQDFPMTPDMVSELKVLTSNYAPEYGSTTSGQIMLVTKSGGSSFHGAAFDYRRTDALAATPWGADTKRTTGATISARTWVARKAGRLWNDRVKSYFYFDYEGFRQRGGTNCPTVSIPSLLERAGDFTDWRDADGNVIPIYDPLTIRPDGHDGYIKDQFTGCDGQHPNVICPDRISRSSSRISTRFRRRRASVR